MLIPALTGDGRKPYSSVDLRTLTGFDGSAVGEATVTPPILVNSAARRIGSGLQSLPINEILKIFRRAADLFARGSPDGLSPEDYVRCATLTSGLPISVTHHRTLGLFPRALRAMDRFLKIQSPGALKVFDRHIYKAGGISVGLVPRGRNVGFIMPGNHPSTHFLWLGALAMKFPIVLRPSEDDVFTPYRLTMALLESGLPEDALAFVPGTHELVDAIVQGCALTVLFGMQQLEDRYAACRNVKVFGPGRSKAIVLAGADSGQAVRTVTRMVMDDAGRGCVNVSAVIVEGDPAKLARALAENLEGVPVISPLAQEAQLGAVRSAAEADVYNAVIDGGLTAGGKEWTPGRSRRVASLDGTHIMRPTVIEVPSFQHPLFGMELPFPFVVLAPVRSRKEILTAARNSLIVAVEGNDRDLTIDLLLDTTIDKVYAGGALSTEFDPREPHEGFLLDFLFEKKGVRGLGNTGLLHGLSRLRFHR